MDVSPVVVQQDVGGLSLSFEGVSGICPRYLRALTEHVLLVPKAVRMGDVA